MIKNRLLSFDFVQGAQTAGADFDMLHFAVDHDGGCMNISIEPPVGMAFGMADILTEHRRFVTNFALQYRNSFDILTSML
jgi:hypothetical protein